MSKNYALIENGVVTNVIAWDGDAEKWQPPEGVTARLIALGETAGIGYTYDGNVFTPPPGPPAPPAPPPAVPAQVTKRQGRLALLAAGKLLAVTDAIAALPSPQKDEAEIEWDAGTYERASPFVALLAEKIGLDSVALDALFKAAAIL